MDDISVTFAKNHLEELIARARRGEAITINDGRGRVQLTAPVISEALTPFVPLSKPRTFGLFKGEIPSPRDDFFDLLNDDELKHWYGDAS